MMTSAFIARESGSLFQGTLVRYSLPHATSLELTGPLNGIVLSLSAYNIATLRPIICPIIYGNSAANEAFGIKVPTESRQNSYFRADLAACVGIKYGNVITECTKNGYEPIMFPQEITQTVYKRHMEMICPTQTKLSISGDRFLAYGQIGYAEHVPHCDQLIYEPAPIVCLTPPEIYKITGTALVTRAYSHQERFNGRSNVWVEDNRWWRRGFFSVKNVTVVSVKGTLAPRNGRGPLEAGFTVMRAFNRKVEATFDEAAWHAVKARYNAPVGEIPKKAPFGPVFKRHPAPQEAACV